MLVIDMIDAKIKINQTGAAQTRGGRNGRESSLQVDTARALLVLLKQELQYKKLYSCVSTSSVDTSK